MRLKSYSYGAKGSTFGLIDWLLLVAAAAVGVVLVLTYWKRRKKRIPEPPSGASEPTRVERTRGGNDGTHRDRRADEGVRRGSRRRRPERRDSGGSDRPRRAERRGEDDLLASPPGTGPPDHGNRESSGSQHRGRRPGPRADRLHARARLPHPGHDWRGTRDVHGT